MLAAAAWLIKASEARNTTLSSQRIKMSALRALTCARHDQINGNAATITPNRSYQTRQNRVSNNTTRHAGADKAFLSDNSFMLATSSQNQSRPERIAAIRLQTAKRNRRRSTSWKSPV